MHSISSFWIIIQKINVQDRIFRISWTFLSGFISVRAGVEKFRDCLICVTLDQSKCARCHRLKGSKHFLTNGTWNLWRNISLSITDGFLSCFFCLSHSVTTSTLPFEVISSSNWILLQLNICKKSKRFKDKFENGKIQVCNLWYQNTY